MRKIALVALCIFWWLCLIATYLMFGIKPAIMAFLSSGIGALAIAVDQNKEEFEEESGNDDEEC